MYTVLDIRTVGYSKRCVLSSYMLEICKSKYGTSPDIQVTIVLLYTYQIIQICSGITSGRVLDGELWAAPR